jgi:protein-S-isoprenylcysteine O-methyltransferase Ste14
LDGGAAVAEEEQMTTLLSVTGSGWLVLELVLILRDRARDKGGTAHDRGTRALNFGLIMVAIVAAGVLPAAIGKHSPLWIPGAESGGWQVVPGLVMAWLGLGVRVWAIVVLGRSFRTTVEVDAGQDVVTRGPYRWVRHPSYTGLLIIAAGLGWAEGTWPGLAICLILPTAATLIRIQVEEAALTRVLGDPYRAYQNRTKRLVPGLW